MDTDDQLMVSLKEEAWCGENQQDPEHLHMKEEQEEVSTRLEGEQLNLKESDGARFPFAAVSIKSEDDEEKPLFSQLQQQQMEDKDVPTSSSADQMTAENGGGAETSRNPDLDPHEQISNSPETEVSGDDVEEEEDDVNLDSKRSVPGPETGDGGNDWNKSRSSGSDVKTVNKSFSCPECGKQFLRKSSLQKHVRVTSHSAVRSSGCLTNKKCVEVKQHVDSCKKVQKELKFSCDYCGKGFSYKSALNSHIRVHTREKPFACNFCSKRYMHTTALKLHMRVHLKKKPLACKICKKKFKLKSKLKSHMIVHKGEKHFSCEFCGKRFGQKAGLTSHMSIHTGEKPFACELCEQRFGRKDYLIRHMSIHTGEKPFACEFCGQRFRQKSFLTSHMRVHSGEKPFACELCEQRFGRKDYLIRHVNVHTGQKPYACELCGQRYGYKNSLNNHMRVHTDSHVIVSSVDRDLASRESTQTFGLINGGVGSKLGELCSDPLKSTVYLILQPHNTSAEMGKTTNKPTQASGEPNKEDNSRGNLTSQTTCAANIPAAPLTRADMESMLQGLEDRITSKLSAQFTVDRALLEQHNLSLQQLETSMNDMNNRMLELETTCSMLMQENKKLKHNTR